MIIMLTPKDLNVVPLGPGIHGCAVSSVSSLKLHTVFNVWACLNFSGEFRPPSVWPCMQAQHLDMSRRGF